MTALDRIQIEGFRSLKKIDLRLGRITVLIGANGSGKSSLLSLLRLVALARTQNLRAFVASNGGASALLHYGPQVTKAIEIALEFHVDDGRANRYHSRLGYASGDTLIFLEESVGYRSHPNLDFRSESLGAGHHESRLDLQPQSSTAKSVQTLLQQTNFFHFHDTSASSPLRQNAKQSDNKYLRSDGSNLAAFMRRLASGSGETSAAWLRISMLIRQVAPFVKRLEPELVDPDRPETSAVRLYWIDEREHRFDVHDFSDGTLRAIALITALAQPANTLPSFVAIDEPELGLHPAAVALFASLVRSVEPRCQVLLATQSPALLDEFGTDHVIVAERFGAETTFRHLGEESLAAWLEDYTLSELFDKNLLGGRP